PYPAGENPFAIDQVLLFSLIFQHETAHIFWALDEYLAALGDCTSHSGYLNVYNRNKLFMDPDGNADNCQRIIPCIMARAKEDLGRPICEYTAGMMGLAIDKKSGVPKIFDSSPLIEFENSAAETVDTDDLLVRFKGISTVVPNKNPFQSPEERIDYGVPLKDATFNVDGVGMVKIHPEDGKWDEMEEDLLIHLTSLPPGLIQIRVSVRNAAGRSSPQYIKKIFNVGLSYSHFQMDAQVEGLRFSWNMVGETFGAVLDLHRIDPDGADRILAAGIAPSDTLSQQFLGYSYFDPDVYPGKRYGYYISGTFTIEFGGERRTYTSKSPIITATARLPIAKGSFVSFPSPNPFNPAKGKLVLSINVPPPPSAINGINGYGSGGATDLSAYGTDGEDDVFVDVRVYDVRGRLVKRLQAEKASAGILTIDWDGTNQHNQLASSGVYFIKIEAGSINQVRKLLLLR
ncbi:MAG: FlgD immunoglobulin-like domain containing protein, partial [Candidatus Latescibacterota bacterium]